MIKKVFTSILLVFFIMILIVEDGYIAAQATGKASKKWEYNIPNGLAVEDLEFSEDGSIYAFVRGQFTGDFTHIHKLNKKGKELWYIRVSGVPIIGEKVLINAHSRIDVYDLQTGKRKHQFNLPKGFKAPVRLALTDFLTDAVTLYVHAEGPDGLFKEY